ncbi:hypothetical protein [Embleya scabrispora]|uniref:hypothetical protein n=1 Tax=Embleya scabrispora TaxID=159449 RepID=UPI001374AF5A|nr:hypothetical protein [Embleya scabrispora]
MTWFLYGLAAWWTLSVLLVIASVGKPRQPLTAPMAAVLTILNFGLIAGLLMVASNIG